MAVKEILKLGNPLLYEASAAVEERELEAFAETVRDLHDTMMEFRRVYKAGRAIAAPQISVFKRLIYMNTGGPVVFFNPRLVDLSTETMELWDDCMCFPDLFVRVKRHRSCRVLYKDEEWRDRELFLEGDLSELIQHEYDHLDGILAVQRALDGKSFALRSERFKTTA